MKKLLILMSAVILFMTPAFAESYNLGEKTIDELLELRQLINAEINGRMVGSDEAFPPFDYAVGKHLPAGMYMISCLEFLNGEKEGRAAAWAAGESSWGCHTILYLNTVGEFGIIDLAEGDTLRIVDCMVTITPYRLPTIK